MERMINELNSHILVETHVLALDSDNALELVSRYDVVVDAR